MVIDETFRGVKTPVTLLLLILYDIAHWQGDANGTKRVQPHTREELVTFWKPTIALAKSKEKTCKKHENHIFAFGLRGHAMFSIF